MLQGLDIVVPVFTDYRYRADADNTAQSLVGVVGTYFGRGAVFVEFLVDKGYVDFGMVLADGDEGVGDRSVVERLGVAVGAG